MPSKRSLAWLPQFLDWNSSEESNFFWMRFDWSPIEMFIVCLHKQKPIYIQFIYLDISADQWTFSITLFRNHLKFSKSSHFLRNHEKFKNLSTIFNTEWHKIGVQVEESSVSLFVDCAKMETVQLGLFYEFFRYNSVI